MLRKSLFVLAVMAMLLVSASAVLAQGGGKIIHFYDEDADTMLPLFDDGRVNAFDIDAPIAIFYEREAVLKLDENGDWTWDQDMIVYEDRLVSLDLWARLPGYETFQKIECCPIDQLIATVDAATQDMILMQKHGYTLGYSVSGYFWVTGPDGYYFYWEK